MPNRHHRTILEQIRKNSGLPTQHTFQDHYLGTQSPRYPINTPALRKIVKTWAKENEGLPHRDIASLITSLIMGTSSTEKTVAGILLDYVSPSQRKFKPVLFNSWLDHVAGWAEVDAMCAGNFSASEIPQNVNQWSALLKRLSKSKNIHKRRASMVLLVAPLRAMHHPLLAQTGLDIVDSLKNEKEILITKAISWLLRSMVKNHRKLVQQYVRDNRRSLPAIAVRETLNKIATGTKSKRTVTSTKRNPS